MNLQIQHNPHQSWSLESWRQFPLIQEPCYLDLKELRCATEKLQTLNPLVPIDEIINLSNRLNDCFDNNGFILQIGDCVEMFHKTDSCSTRESMRFFANAGQSLKSHLKRPITIMARIAGQFSKPRTSLTEMIQNVVYPSFHGEFINGYSLDQRTPNPWRMIKGYDVCRFLLQDMRQLGYAPYTLGSQVFTHHEAYLLPYEEGLTRYHEGQWYNTSAHSVWIGNWTIGEHTAHIEFVRGLANPIGFKLGPTLKPQTLRQILEQLDPVQRQSKIILMPRLGLQHIQDKLPPLIEIAKDFPVLWVLDPMHGNTIRCNSKKTRRFTDIAQELKLFLDIMDQNGLRPHGIHCEATADDVTECLDPERFVTEENLNYRYLTGCDPRLNPTQVMALIELCGELWL